LIGCTSVKKYCKKTDKKINTKISDEIVIILMLFILSDNKRGKDIKMNQNTENKLSISLTK
jgi:hypothetical protein